MMKKYLAIILISLFIWSCGGSGGDEPPPPPPAENKAPTTPSLNLPSNAANDEKIVCILNTVDFEWVASTDPEGDAIKYKLDISRSDQFTTIENSTDNSGTSTSITLEKGVAYYWRVKATDSKNASSSYSATFKFYTEAEGTVNHLPFAPELKKPTLDLVVQETNTDLEWEAYDEDTEDVLKFYVFLGTNEDNVNDITTDEEGNYSDDDLIDSSMYPIIQDSSNSQLYRIEDFPLDPAVNYYWKVFVDDGNGGITKGQLWTFKTD